VTLVWSRLEDTGPRVALTFDDCDSAPAWDRVLDVLARNGARATFFPLGMRLGQYPEQAHRTLAGGHALGSHGFDHVYLNRLPLDELNGHFQRDREVWNRVVGGFPRYFRPPFGAFNDETLSAIRGWGYRTLVLWDVDPEDWKEPGAKAIIERVLRRARPGSVVLLHALEQTAESLTDIINGLRGRGLEGCSLDEMFDEALTTSSC
jgi:peptidoglycan-N-acetylglucosamine deacetylase